MQKQRWVNDHMEAWVNEDGTLVIRRKVNIPMDGFPYHYAIDTLEPQLVQNAIT